MTKLYGRWQKQIIQNAIKTRRVVLLAGARQCGKTTLTKQLVSKETRYLTLDDPALRQLAKNDPVDFVKHDRKMLIIDEVQRVPELLSAIKLIVDEDTHSGQYLLTGSANISSLPSVQESLAGRIRKIRLRSLSQGELLGAKPNFLENTFKKIFSKTSKNTYDRKTMLELAFRGGFPEAIKLEQHERCQWHRDYISALLERDLKDIAHITRQQAMSELVNTLAAWSGRFMDISSIGSGLSIRRPTIESYINALEALYVIERVSPWTCTDYDRVGKQSKIYMTDSGLMTSILRWRLSQVELDSDRSGKLIETFIFNELATQIDANNGQYELSHYRDREKREIDFLIERDDHALLGIEVKASSTINTSDFKHLKWFKENIAKNRLFIGIVLYSGEFSGSMGENLFAVPYENLWITAK
ncbi:MAG: ATP-binding protein [Gammaproteobacteria bacterium]|nr:ATP-binding protein [Gammaproteobacteria bacterium]